MCFFPFCKINGEMLQKILLFPTSFVKVQSWKVELSFSFIKPVLLVKFSFPNINLDLLKYKTIFSRDSENSSLFPLVTCI